MFTICSIYRCHHQADKILEITYIHRHKGEQPYTRTVKRPYCFDHAASFKDKANRTSNVIVKEAAQPVGALPPTS